MQANDNDAGQYHGADLSVQAGGASGQVAIRNSSGTVNVLADLEGDFIPGA